MKNESRCVMAPNFTQIPNVFFDYWMNVLTPAEFKVLMCIARKTFGWMKVKDKISIKQIEKLTSLSRKGVIEALKKLEDNSLISKIKSKTEDGDDAPNQYEIYVIEENSTQPNISSPPDSMPIIAQGSELSTLGVVNSVHQGVVYSVHPQYKEYTKENIQNNNSAEAHEVRTSPPSQKDFKKNTKAEVPNEVVDLSSKMVSSMLEIKPDYKVPTNMTKFHMSVDAMLRIDKRKPEEILKVFQWCLCDPFWSDKFFRQNPAEYLREKFDQLQMKASSKPITEPIVTNKVDRRTKNVDGTPIESIIDGLF